MKILIVFMLALLFASTAYPATGDLWCQSDGGALINCSRENDKGWFKNGKTWTATKDNNVGFKRVITLGSYNSTTEIKTGYIVNTKTDPMTRTITKRAKTIEEVNQTNSRTLSFEMYTVLKWMVTQGVIDPATAPAGLRKAYLARKALGQ